MIAVSTPVIWIGAALGLALGVWGTYFGIKHTRGPRERAYVVGCAIRIWAGCGLFLTLMSFTPPRFRSIVWLVFAFALARACRRMNEEQRRLRLEGDDEPPLPPPSET